MISLCRPSIGPEELNKIDEVLKSGWLTHGPYNEQFEKIFADYSGVTYAQTVNSCASALFIVLKALNITGEVIIPSFTFIATASAVVLAGATPVFADIDYDTGNITADTIRPLINNKTQAVIPVHFAGQSCQMTEIVKLCQENDLTLIEDSAEAIGATCDGKKTGSFGIGCFSFFPTKNITTGEGGMITSSDMELMHKIKVLISHGVDKTSATKYAWQREAIVPGYNLRMSGILAGLGIVQMGKLDAFNAKRREHAKFLSENLDQEFIKIPVEKNNCQHVYQMYTIKITANKRDEFVEKLKAAGIGASVHFSPAVHEQQAFKKFATDPLPNTNRISSEIVTLPMFPDLTAEELKTIANTCNNIIRSI